MTYSNWLIYKTYIGLYYSHFSKRHTLFYYLYTLSESKRHTSGDSANVNADGSMILLRRITRSGLYQFLLWSNIRLFDNWRF